MGHQIPSEKQGSCLEKTQTMVQKGPILWHGRLTSNSNRKGSPNEQHGYHVASTVGLTTAVRIQRAGSAVSCTHTRVRKCPDSGPSQAASIRQWRATLAGQCERSCPAWTIWNRCGDSSAWPFTFSFIKSRTHYSLKSDCKKSNQLRNSEKLQGTLWCTADSRRIAGTKKSFYFVPERVDGWCWDDIGTQCIPDLGGWQPERLGYRRQIVRTVQQNGWY